MLPSGGSIKIIPMKSTDPGPAVQQAIDEGVDFIASTGLSIAQYQPQLDAAKAAGITVLSCFGTDDPDPEAGLYMQCGDESFVEKTGPVMADWAIVDSEGTANVLIVNIPDFPVLVAEIDAYKAQLAKNCSGCKTTELNVTLQDLIGGTIPASVVSKLQANPDVNYIYYAFGDLPGGVTCSAAVRRPRQAGHAVRSGLQHHRPPGDRRRHDGRMGRQPEGICPPG